MEDVATTERPTGITYVRIVEDKSRISGEDFFSPIKKGDWVSFVLGDNTYEGEVVERLPLDRSNNTISFVVQFYLGKLPARISLKEERMTKLPPSYN